MGIPCIFRIFHSFLRCIYAYLRINVYSDIHWFWILFILERIFSCWFWSVKRAPVCRSDHRKRRAMRYSVNHCGNNGHSGIAHVGAAILPPATFRIQPVWLNGAAQCSGGNLPPWIFEFVTTNKKTYVIPTAASAEWRNPPRWIMNQHKIKLATREDSSTRLRSLGMTWRGVVPFNRTGCICHAPGTAHRPFPTVSLVGCTVQAHGF